MDERVACQAGVLMRRRGFRGVLNSSGTYHGGGRPVSFGGRG